jgi:hypothetical protein
LNQVKGAERQGERSPYIVASGLERFTFTHSSIFTGISAKGKGK